MGGVELFTIEDFGKLLYHISGAKPDSINRSGEVMCCAYSYLDLAVVRWMTLRDPELQTEALE
jgi:hypothetical protein